MHHIFFVAVENFESSNLRESRQHMHMHTHIKKIWMQKMKNKENKNVKEWRKTTLEALQLSTNVTIAWKYESELFSCAVQMKSRKKIKQPPTGNQNSDDQKKGSIKKNHSHTKHV